MRRQNLRLVIVGSVLMVTAAGFFLFFMTIASKSNDPVALMRTVGAVSGVVGALGIVIIAIGLIGKER